MISEDNYLDSWYEWEVVEENLRMDISPEAMVAINSGFGTSRGIPNMTGELQWNEEKLVFQIGNLKIRRSNKVKFYKQAALFEITDLNDDTTLPKKVIMKDSKIKHLYLSEDVYQLDNSNGPIYNANEKFGLELNEQSAIDYLYFFFYNVKGRHGRFYPVASYDQLNPLVNISEGNTFTVKYSFEPVEEDAPDLHSLNYSIKAAVRQDANDVPVEPGSESQATQTFVVDDVVLVFKDSIFSSIIKINAKDGMVTLSNEKLLYEGSAESNKQ